MMSRPVIRFRCVTLRRSGATEIRIVQAASADAARERLIAAGLEPVSIEAVGPSLLSSLYRRMREPAGWGAWLSGPRLRVVVPVLGLRRYMVPAALLVATIPLTVAAGSWGLALVNGHQADRLARRAAPQIAAQRDHILSDRARVLAAPVMAAPGIGVVLTRLAAILPADAGLASAARDAAGVLVIEIDTPDPDGLRPILAADPLLGALREIGQTSTDEGTIRVTLTMRA